MTANLVFPYAQFIANGQNMKAFNQAVIGIKESIFSTITQMANTQGAINLAQGFPDFEGPEWVLQLAQKAFFNGKNQYAASYGLLALRQQITQGYHQFYGLDYDPQNQILITNGATEAIYATITALINPGDEVVAFEPVYDSYLAAVKIVGGVLKPVTLHAPDFHFSVNELAGQITTKTKLLILNNPHNPTGRVFSLAELQIIGDLAKKFDFYILSDEVYEFLTYDCQHIPIAKLSGLKDRVLTTSSVGKTLSLTGWKVGWLCGPAEVIKAVHNVHQFIAFCVAHPLQAAVSEAWARLDEYLPSFRADYTERRKILVTGLQSLGFEVMVPQGSYFTLVRVPDGENDVDFCKNLILRKKVAAIPCSSFYIHGQEGERLIRFCFAKKTETLMRALDFLGKT
jgi:aspartate/methionine/tyrosine aminotransferase